MRFVLWSATVAFLSLSSLVASAGAQDKPAADDPVAEDLKLLQGKWEMLHVNDKAGEPTLRSVKEIEGNRETLRRYDIKSGKLLREHTVEFSLSRSGDVRIFTFYAVGGDPKQGQSFIYKVDGDSFYDAPGLLQGDTYRNYSESPAVWHWKKVKAEAAAEPRQPKTPQ
jgi:hypothetical protein